MQIVRRLLQKRLQGGRNHKIRGLSTAELIGIIIIVGVLGALGGTYIGSLVGSANKNAIAQNINSLNTVCASMLSGGVPIAATANGPITAVGTDALTGDKSGTQKDSTVFITELNKGYTDATTGVTYKMTPPISQNSYLTYVANVNAVDASGDATSITWSQGTGTTP